MDIPDGVALVPKTPGLQHHIKFEELSFAPIVSLDHRIQMNLSADVFKR